MCRISFTEWAMNIADMTKSRSTCLSRQVGAVIVKDRNIIATGYNGAPSKANHCTNHIGKCARKELGFESGQGLEFCRAGHAESNAIDQCAKHGNSCDNSVMYVTTMPCSFCTIRIIQAGIKKVVYKEGYPSKLSIQLAKETGLVFRSYEEELVLKENYGEDAI